MFGSLLKKKEEVFIVDKEGIEYLVDPDTVCQLVASIDGEPFYEGDILTHIEGSNWIINYREDLSAFVLVNEEHAEEWIRFAHVAENIEDWEFRGSIHNSSDSCEVKNVYFFHEFTRIRKKGNQIVVEGTVSNRKSSPVNLSVTFDSEEDFYDALKGGMWCSC